MSTKSEAQAKAQKKYKATHKAEVAVASRKHYLKRAMLIDSYKLAHGCCLCGYNEHACALDLHHRDPSEKEFTVSRMKSLALPAIIREMSKCDVYCANCHRVIHTI